MATTSNNHEQDHLRERPIGELLKQLSEETTTLVKQELDLAKVRHIIEHRLDDLLAFSKAVLAADPTT